MRLTLHADDWAEAAGSDPADAARDACWYLSDALQSLPHLGEDGCPADLRTVPGWTEEQDILGAVDITARWRVDCAAADWIAWRTDPGPYLDGHAVVRGRAREDLSFIVVEGLACMALLEASRAVMTLRHP